MNISTQRCPLTQDHGKQTALMPTPFNVILEHCLYLGHNIFCNAQKKNCASVLQHLSPYHSAMHSMQQFERMKQNFHIIKLLFLHLSAAIYLHYAVNTQSYTDFQYSRFFLSKIPGKSSNMEHMAGTLRACENSTNQALKQ